MGIPVLTNSIGAQGFGTNKENILFICKKNNDYESHIRDIIFDKINVKEKLKFGQDYIKSQMSNHIISKKLISIYSNKGNNE